MSTDYKPVHTPVYTQADLDQARKEARAAAFKDITKAAQAENPPHNSGNEYARGFARAKKTIIGKIEAAANTEEGGGDGSDRCR